MATLAAGWIGSAHAGEHFYDFNPPNGNPNDPASGFVLFGTQTNGWQTNGGFTGVDGDGFLEITPAIGGLTLGILFPLDYFTNADNSLTALPLKGFTVEADVRVGNATGNNGRPADGFSISFASSLDPVVYWGNKHSFQGWAGGDDNTTALQPPTFNYGTGGGSIDPTTAGSGDAENGTKTGVSVQFDTWSGNIILDQNGVPAADNVGWRVHYNGRMIQRILAQPPSGPLTLSPDGANDLNGLAVCPAPLAPADFTQDASCEALVCADTNSIQTGPYYLDDDGLHNGSTSNLCWTHLSVELTTNSPHLLTVIYKNRTLVDHVALTNFSPYVGQLVMGGRTGGANENRDIDNVHIVTFPAVQSVYGGITSASLFRSDFSISLGNVGPAKVTTINTLTLDGQDIKGSATITLGDPNSTIKYTSATPFVSGSSHTVVINWTDGAGITQNQLAGFTVVNWLTVPASAAVTSVDTTQPGFLVAPSQIDGSEPNRLYWAEEQLMGLRGSNHVDLSIFSTTNNEIEYNDLVDFSHNSAGQFSFNQDFAAFGLPAADLGPNPNNAAVAIMTYLYFPAPGMYVFGGNSDDGLRLTFAQNSHDVLGTRVPGMFADVGRGISPLQNIGAVVITNAGYYGFRLLYENGGGGAGLELYTTQTPSTVTNILVNDVNNASPNQVVAAYMFAGTAPYVSYAEPPLDDDQVAPSTDYTWKITDGATTVKNGSVVLKLNGVQQSPSLSTAGGVTTLVVAHTPGSPWPAGTNVVDLSFQDSANKTYAYNYSFIIPAYASLPASAATPASSVDQTKPGFNMTMYKVDQEGGQSSANRFHAAEQMLAGLWGPNVATGSSFVITNINFDINTNLGGSSATDGDFNNDQPFPGLNGTGVAQHPYESYTAEFDTWMVFPNEGTYTFIFNSDDGFRTMLSNPQFTRPVNNGQLTVLTPQSLAGDKLAVWGSNRGDAVGATNTTGVSGKLVLAQGTAAGLDPTLGCGTNGLANAGAIAGNIALMERGTCGFLEKINDAASAGAIAIVMAQNRPETSPGDGWFPIEITGGPPAVSVPVVMIGLTNYWALTNAMGQGTVNVRLNPIDDSNTLGVSDIGKGASDVNYTVYVPAAGAYPLRTIYWQGGGGGNAEWSTVAFNGNKYLLNNTNALALQSYRAATVVAKPTVSISRSGSTVSITYTGTLQSSSTVNGTYSPVSGATSPYTVPTASATAQFYKTK
jgi:hypothetical protein